MLNQAAGTQKYARSELRLCRLGAQTLHLVSDRTDVRTGMSACICALSRARVCDACVREGVRVCVCACGVFERVRA